MKVPAGNSVSNARNSEYIQNPSDVQAEILHAIENEEKIITEQILMAENVSNVVKQQILVIDKAHKLVKEQVLVADNFLQLLNEQVCVADNATKLIKESGERVKQLLEKKMSLARSDQSSLIENDDESMEKIRKGNELDSQNTQNSSVIKRKAESPPAGAGSSKIAKKEPFSCELCDVVVQCEVTLLMHIQGKKHKKAVLKEQQMEQNGVVSNDRNLATITGINSNRNLEQIAGDDTISKGTTPGVTTGGNAVQIAGDDTISKGTTLGVTTDGNAVQVTQRTVGGHKILKAVDGDIFVCEVCRVGAQTVEAMNAHKKEKEHLDKLLVVANSGGTQI